MKVVTKLIMVLVCMALLLTSLAGCTESNGNGKQSTAGISDNEQTTTVQETGGKTRTKIIMRYRWLIGMLI